MPAARLPLFAILRNPTEFAVPLARAIARKRRSQLNRCVRMRHGICLIMGASFAAKVVHQATMYRT